MNRFFKYLSLIAIIFFLSNYFLILNQKRNELINCSEKIDTILTENFKQTEKILIFIGKKIATDSPNLDLKNIHKIFYQAASLYGDSHIFSWSLFDWVDNNGLQKVNTVLGVNTTNPTNMLDRHYTFRGLDQGILLFSKATIGSPSNALVIPIGVRISTKLYSRAGTVVIGMDLKKLLDLINPNLNKNIHFVIIDKRDNSFVFGSYNVEKYFSGISYKKLDFINDSLVLPKEMDPKYPYKILVGYDKNRFWQEVISSSLKVSLQFIVIVLLVVFLKKRK